MLCEIVKILLPSFYIYKCRSRLFKLYKTYKLEMPIIIIIIKYKEYQVSPLLYLYDIMLQYTQLYTMVHRAETGPEDATFE